MPITFNHPLDTSSLKGRSALVTGAATGIGLACATKLAEAGALVTLADMNQAAGTAAAQHLSSQGLKAHFVTCDVTSYEAQVNMFNEAIKFGNGNIDVVVPNAGIVAEKNLFDMVPPEAPSVGGPAPPEPGFSTCNVNLHAVYNTCYLAMHYFRLPRKEATTFSPSIVLVSSMAGYVGYPSSTTYSIAKFGVRGLLYSIRDRATQCVPPVRVNLVAPCFIDTDLTRAKSFVESTAGFMAKVMGFVPMERVVDSVMRFSADESLHGRVAGIFPAGDEDLGDDLEGSYAGPVVVKHFVPITQQIIKVMTEAQAQAPAPAQ